MHAARVATANAAPTKSIHRRRTLAIAQSLSTTHRDSGPAFSVPVEIPML